MPIKLFARRKSSGNALEDATAAAPAPGSSFKVFERPNQRKSFDGITALRQASGGHAKNDSVDDPYADNIFAGIEKPAPANNRGSSGTNNSTSTGRLYDSSSSAKYSSSSTLPSSTDTSAHETPAPRVPETPFAYSLRAAANRTFSFGSKPPKTPPRVQTAPSQAQADPFPPPPPPPAARDRTMTTSTASTATPPKLMDSDLKLGDSSDWGNMFDEPGKRKSPVPNQAEQESFLETPRPREKGGRKSVPSFLSPFQFDRASKAEPSPTSTDSRTSRDGLMGQSQAEPASTRDRELPPLPSDSDSNSSPVTVYGGQGKYPAGAQTLPVPEPRHKFDPDASSIYGSDNDFTHVPINRLTSNSNTPANPSSNLSPPDEEVPLFSAEAGIAAQYENQPVGGDVPKPQKVMTSSQFERYKEQKELSRQDSNVSRNSSDASGDNYEEDEDEVEEEKKRQAAAQRRKQEAHLSVYRQQMMKVTSDRPKSASPAYPSRNSSDEANATPTEEQAPPTIANRTSTFLSTPPADNGVAAKSSDGEEDDEVPLGILAAHGFPNRNKPPGALTASNSNPNLRASFQPSYTRPPPGTTGEPPAGPRKTLPAFARNLPKDPYYGASLVNPSNRESMAMRSGASNVGEVPPSMHPGGLVGVIASEERARAMRRGSSNVQTGHDVSPAHNPHQSMLGGPGTLLGQHQGRASTMPMPQTQDMLSPNDPAQVSQQMAQMMQMQMQWMQQVMQMQGMQQMGGQQPPQPPFNMPNPSQPNMMPQPPTTPGGRQYDQRTLNMLDPSHPMNPNQNPNRRSFAPSFHDGGNNHLNAYPNQGYTPSIAPSERSNVGNAARYRPVSMAPPGPNAPGSGPPRASTFTSSTLHPWGGDEARRNSLTVPSQNNNYNNHNTNNRPKSRSPSPAYPATTSTPASASPNPTIRPISQLRQTSSTPTASSGLRNSVVDSSSNNGSNGNNNNNNNKDDDDEDDEGWEEMLQAREKRKTGWRFKKAATTNSFGDLYHGDSSNAI